MPDILRWCERTTEKGNPVQVTEELRKLRDRAGLSMRKLAIELGYKDASSYQRYEDQTLFKKQFLPDELIEKLLRVLPGRGDPKITREEILRLGRLYKLVIKGQAGEVLLSGLRETPLNTTVPIIKASQVAMLTGEKVTPGIDTQDYVSVGRSVSDKAFCLVITDNSMSPEFNEGDHLICDPAAEIRPGDYVIAKLKTEIAASVRRYRVKNLLDNGQKVIELVPLNSDYPTATISDNSAGTVYARVVEHRRKV